MSGNHTQEHSHSKLIVPGPAGFRQPRRLHRRAFLGYFGKGTAALAILGPVAVACSSSTPVAQGATTTQTDPPNQAGSAADADGDPSTTSTTVAEIGSLDAGQWGRVSGVAAYVLARGSDVAIVDTGGAGSVDAIGQTITDLGLNFSNVKHVALTHAHPDHVGSIGAILSAAENAIAYAGVADVDRIQAELVGVSDGDDIFGMRVVGTPGHTVGHISMYDELTSTLIAGDAMNGVDGGVGGANPSFTQDMDLAGESIKALAQLQFDNVYFGHGEPVLGGASTAVIDLAATL